jgi:hypothetical protein
MADRNEVFLKDIIDEEFKTCTECGLSKPELLERAIEYLRRHSNGG